MFIVHETSYADPVAVGMYFTQTAGLALTKTHATKKAKKVCNCYWQHNSMQGTNIAKLPLALSETLGMVEKENAIFLLVLLQK